MTVNIKQEALDRLSLCLPPGLAAIPSKSNPGSRRFCPFFVNSVCARVNVRVCAHVPMPVQRLEVKLSSPFPGGSLIQPNWLASEPQGPILPSLPHQGWDYQCITTLGIFMGFGVSNADSYLAQ